MGAITFACVVGLVLGGALGGVMVWLWGRGARAVARAEAQELRRRVDDQKTLLSAAEARLGEAFRAAAAEALQANSQGFLTLASERLGAREQAIDAMVKPVRESLDKVDGKIQELERERGQAYGRLLELVRQMAAGQEKLQGETANLARALRAPAVRGRWGEVQLRRVVEMAGMLEHCDFGQQTTVTTDTGARVRPDLLVRLPGGRHVVVDAKAPLEAYLDALETTSDEQRRQRMAQHAQQVRAHVLKLGAKGYWADVSDTPEFVVLFLPSEAIYSAALEQAPSLIEEGVSRRVLIATPTTLIALLQTVHFGWRQENLAEDAKKISEQGRILHERLAVLLEHWSKLGAALGRATEHFNGAVASLDARVLPAARKLDELGVAGRKELVEPAQVEARPRVLLASRELDTEPTASEPA